MADPLSPAPPGRAWVVIHARPRCEKKVEAVAGQQGATGYLPLRRRSHRYGGRVRVFTSPLFPGYVFLCAEPATLTFLRQNRHVARVLAVDDEAQLLEQLRHIRTAIEVGDVAEVLPYLEAGRRVRVARGPFRGLEGLVQTVRGRTRIVVNLDIIREAVAVEIDSALLDPA